MKSRTTGTLLSLLVLLPVAPVTVVADPLLLEPVTVTASRHLRPLSTTPAAVTVLEADALATLADLPLEDILVRHAGVTLARSGGAGQQTSLFLRGSNSDSVLVLVDGVKFNGGAFGGASLQQLRGADIARIEVVRGPRSTLYGSEAVGGVIAITTRRSGAVAAGEALDSASLRLAGGSDRSGEWRAAASHLQPDRHVALGAGHARTDGDPLTDSTAVSGRHRNDSGYLNASTTHGNTRWGIDSLAGSGSTRYVDCVYDAFFACVGTVALDQQFEQAVAALWSDTRLDDQHRLRTRLGHATDRLDQLQSTDFARTRRHTATLELERRQGGHVLVAGLDAEDEQVDALIYGAALGADTRHHALFLRNDWTGERHQLGVGLRHTRYDSFGNQLTGEASWGLQLDRDSYAWLAAGRGFRAPDATERFGFGGNPALRPEQSDSVELGLRHRRGGHGYTLALFAQRITDLIDYPPPTFDAVNIARAENQGAELGWQWEDSRRRAAVFATLQDPVDDNGQPLARRPRQQLNADYSQSHGRLGWRLALLAMGERDNSAFDNRTLPGFAVLDAGVSWQALPALALDLRVENIGDRDYTLASGSAGDYRMPDRAFFLGIAWRGESRYRRH